MRAISKTVLLSALVLGLCACQDPGTSSPTSPKTPARGRLLSFSDQAQTCNAYDWFGWFHNQGLRYGLTWQDDYDVVDTITTSFMIGDFIVDFDTTDTYDTSDVYALAHSVDSLHQTIRSYTSGKTRAQIISGLAFSTAGRQTITDLLYFVDHSDELPFLLECDTLVGAIQSNSSIDSSEKIVLLTIVSVAYHSFQFWDYYFQNDGLLSHRSSRVFVDNPDKRKTKSVVESDVVGAAVGAGIGFAGGAIGGAIFGTVVGTIISGGTLPAPGAAAGAAFGALTGAIRGAIGGALAGSVYEGIVKPMIENDSNTEGGSGGQGENPDPPGRRRRGP